jgi:activator of 2-hydroxyglutaryl-CoA dehydratase
MKVFGYNRKGFLYIDTGSHLISQQTMSDESNMINKYCTLKEFENYDVAKSAYKSAYFELAEMRKNLPKLTEQEIQFCYYLCNER